MIYKTHKIVPVNKAEAALLIFSGCSSAIIKYPIIKIAMINVNINSSFRF